MGKYKIVGYERTTGTRKNNTIYDFHTLHCVSERPLRGNGNSGNAVLTQMVGADDGILTQIPAVGEVWELEFNSRGRLQDAYLAE